MKGFVIVRSDGAFVADMKKSTTGGSYTKYLQYAKVYPSHEASERDLCVGNERIADLNDLLKPRTEERS